MLAHGQRTNMSGGSMERDRQRPWMDVQLGAHFSGAVHLVLPLPPPPSPPLLLLLHRHVCMPSVRSTAYIMPLSGRL